MMAMGSEFIGPHFEDAETSTSNPQNFVGLLVFATSFTEIVKWLKDLVNMFFVFKGVDQSTSEKGRILERTSPLRATTLRFLPTEIGWEMLISHELTAKSGGFSHGLNQQQEHSRPIFCAYWPAHRHEFSPKERTCVWAEIYYARHSHTYTWATTCNNYLLFYSLGDCHRLVINNHRVELETLPFFIELDRLRKGHSRKIPKNDKTHISPTTGDM